MTMYSYTEIFFERNRQVCQSAVRSIVLGSHFSHAAQAAVHQIAHRLVADAHYLADVVVFATLYII